MTRILFTLLMLLSVLPADAESAHKASGASETPAALKALHARAEAGDAYAQLNLGGAYFEGSEVGHDYAEGTKWFRLAARQGLAEAQFNLGMIYAAGLGVAQNAAEATRWYRLAADQGLSIAELNLGVAYTYGQGVEKNEVEAAKWFRLAADQGEAQAQFNLAVMYAKGQGVKQDLIEAYRYARLAAAQKHEIARALLAELTKKMSIEQQTRAAKLAEESRNHTNTPRAGTLTNPLSGSDAAYAQLVANQAPAETGSTKLLAAEREAGETAPLTAAASAIQPLPAMPQHKMSDTPEIQLKASVRDWAAAWSGKNIPAYLASYMPDFRTADLTHDEWMKQRSDRIARPRTIAIRLSRIEITLQDDSHAAVTFTQDYRSDNYRDRQTKTLLMVKPDQRWLIAEEHDAGASTRNVPPPNSSPGKIH